MADNKEWQKLNLPQTSTYIEFPIAFTGKPKCGKATIFTGLLLSCQFILAIIHTMNKAFRASAYLPYEYFVEEFGMSKETVRNAFKELKERKIIEQIKRSHYKIIVSYNKSNHVEIDSYMFKQLWNVGGKQKRFTYSRLLSLALLKRGNENPKTGGAFVSSQLRIGKAINIPRTTAGDSIRELKAAGLIRAEKVDGNDQRRRGCSLFTVHPEIFAVKHPPRLNSDNYKQDYNADELHKRLMLDTEYKNLIERINVNYNLFIQLVIKERGNDTTELQQLEAEQDKLRAELHGYFKKYHIRREFFPLGFFKCDKQNNN